MSTKRVGRIQKTAAIVPLALLSAAWTASLAGVGATAVTNVAAAESTSLPDGTSVPTETIDAPASVSAPGEVAPGVTGNTQQIVKTSSTNGIPASALAAYQRAETVINSADKSCNLTWQLVAAIGRVESNHGRFGGNALDADGVAKPGIFGLPLNGKNNTSSIRDTDAGQYDNDTVYDRAVGPMQFIPSTWSVVGVDADNDSQRNPQDIDDAGLATAVYLCSGNDDLGTVAGQRTAVYRYNHSASYVNLVLSLMENYLEGDFMTVPDGTISGGLISPTYTGNPGSEKGPDRTGQPNKGGNEGISTDNGGDEGGNDNGEVDNGTEEPPATNEPDGPDSPGPGVQLPSVKVPELPKTGVDPVDQTLSLAQAIVQCTLNGLIDNPLKAGDPFDSCIAGYTS